MTVGGVVPQPGASRRDISALTIAPMHTTALVLFSGGQDSTTCLAHALQRYQRVETIGLAYGQRHLVEMDARLRVLAELRRQFPAWAQKLGVDHVLDVGVLGQVSETGVCETDFSGYPDCRDDTMKALQVALSLGMDRRLLIETPLMWLDKAQTWALAEQLGDAAGVPAGGQALVDLIVEHSHTCYLGDREHRHGWGWGCGSCPACELRARGWQRWRDAQAASLAGMTA